MEDCYRILGVPSSACASEIKRAFRKRAKAIHPDIPGDATGAADRQERMRELIRAYKVLSDPERRTEFDALYSAFKSFTGGTGKDDGFDYRLWLMQREDAESRAKLIFFDLFHDLEDEAILEYRTRRGESGGFVLSRFFGREDFMDCAFILAEELSLRGDYYESFLLLSEVIRLERERPYFRHFFPEVILLVRDILRNRLIGAVPDELALDCLETALELSLGKREDAYVLKLMTGCYERMGDAVIARRCLEEALRLDPSLPGIRDLRKRLAL